MLASGLACKLDGRKAVHPPFKAVAVNASKEV